MSRNFDPKVFGLGYIALGVPDLARTAAHYRETMGLTETDTDQRDTVYLSVGADHHNIVLRKADDKTFLHLGFHLKPGTELSDFCKDVRALGLPAEIQHDSQPGIESLVQVVGPGGHVFQFYDQPNAAASGFATRGIAPLRLGHVAVLTPEAEKLNRFYQDFLGFHYTDDIGGVATFMTCNRDHHVVNVVGIPESRIHHIAFELRDNTDHFRASDLLAGDGTPTLWGPARHGAGHNLASYHYDPDQVMIELYTQMDVYLPALGMQEPRPWHDTYPMRPQSWPFEKMTIWNTAYGFDLATA